MSTKTKVVATIYIRVAWVNTFKWFMAISYLKQFELNWLDSFTVCIVNCITIKLQIAVMIIQHWSGIWCTVISHTALNNCYGIYCIFGSTFLTVYQSWESLPSSSTQSWRNWQLDRQRFTCGSNAAQLNSEKRHINIIGRITNQSICSPSYKSEDQSKLNKFAIVNGMSEYSQYNITVALYISTLPMCVQSLLFRSCYSAVCCHFCVC